MKKYVSDIDENKRINLIKNEIDNGLSNSEIAERFNQSEENVLKDRVWIESNVEIIKNAFRLDKDIKEKKKKLDREKLSEKGLKKCQFCAEEIKIEAIKCRFCNSSFKIKEYNTNTKISNITVVDGMKNGLGIIITIVLLILLFIIMVMLSR